MNEFEIIRRISGELPQVPPEVLVAIGDDCAVLLLGGSTWLAASDMLVYGHHFKGWAAPEDVGYKAVAVDRKSTRLNSSHANISYAVFCLKYKIDHPPTTQP